MTGYFSLNLSVKVTKWITDWHSHPWLKIDYPGFLRHTTMCVTYISTSKQHYITKHFVKTLLLPGLCKYYRVNKTSVIQCRKINVDGRPWWCPVFKWDLKLTGPLNSLPSLHMPDVAQRFKSTSGYSLREPVMLLQAVWWGAALQPYGLWLAVTCSGGWWCGLWSHVVDIV